MSSDRIHLLRLRLGARLRIGGPAIQIAGADCGKGVRIEVEVRGFNEYMLAGDLAWFGSILEVLEIDIRLLVKDGPAILADIGLPSIRMACPHFHEWLLQIEAHAPGHSFNLTN